MSEQSPTTFEIPQLGVDDHVTGECSPETLHALNVLSANPMMHLSVVALARNYEAGNEGLRAGDLEESAMRFVSPPFHPQIPKHDTFRALAILLTESGITTSESTTAGTFYRLKPKEHEHVVALSTVMLKVPKHYPDCNLQDLWGERRVKNEVGKGTFVLRYNLLRALEAKGVSSVTALATEIGLEPGHVWEVRRLTNQGVLCARNQPHPKDRLVSFVPPPPDLVTETAEGKLLADLTRTIYEGDGAPFTMSEHALGQRLTDIDRRARRAVIREALVQAQLTGELSFIHYVNPEHGLRGSQVVEFSPDWLRPVKAMLQSLVELSDAAYLKTAYARAFELTRADVYEAVRHYNKRKQPKPIPPQPPRDAFYIGDQPSNQPPEADEEPSQKSSVAAATYYDYHNI